MSTGKFGRLEPRTRGASKGALIGASAVAVAAIVGVAFTIAAPPDGSGSAAAASFVAHARSGNARLSAASLHALLNARMAPVRATITSGGVTAGHQVDAMLTAGSTGSSSDGNVLTLHVPAIANLHGSVSTSLAPITSQMRELSGSDGQVASSVNDGVTGISPLLSLAGPHAKVTANVPVDLEAAVTPRLNRGTSAGVVTLDPGAGTVAIDLSKLSGNQTGSGNQAGSEDQTSQTLSPADIAEIDTDINAAASGLGDGVVNAATKSAETAPVTVNANVSLLSAPTGNGSSSCSAGSQPDATRSGTGAGILGGVLDGVLGGSVGGTVGGTVDGVLCSLPTQVVPTLLTSLGLTANGTVGQFVEGTASPATGSVTVLGAPRTLNGSNINGRIANAIVNNFAGTTGAEAGGTSHRSSGGASAGSGGLGIVIDANGATDGLGLGGLEPVGAGLGLGGLQPGGASGSGGISVSNVTPQILDSLLTGGSTLPIGIAVVGGTGADGSSANTAGDTTSSGSNLIDIHARSNHGPGARVKIGGAGTSGSSSHSGSGTSGSSSGSGLLGLVSINAPSTGSNGSALINLGL